MEGQTKKLIVGLGNPGTRYKNTRHNLGFKVIDEFALEKGLKFQFSVRFNGELAKMESEGQSLFLLKPQTYMNLSGSSVKKCLDFYKLKKEDIIIVVDDVSIDFGEIKLKPKGSSGGHNGLKHIESLIGSDYPRLKMGIGAPSGHLPLEDYVLENFSTDENNQLGVFIDRGVEVLKQWLSIGLEKTMNQVNTKTTN